MHISPKNGRCHFCFLLHYFTGLNLFGRLGLGYLVESLETSAKEELVAASSDEKKSVIANKLKGYTVRYYLKQSVW